jgi:hypothetical protein
MVDEISKSKAFVVMPFDKEFDDIYEQFIREALIEAGFDVFRADDLLNRENILKDIVNSIVSSDLIIAELTGANPNVFYELGIAHGLNKPTILVTQAIEDIPFDLRPYRILLYDVHFTKIQDAKKKLLNLAKRTLKGEISFGNPLVDFNVSNYPLAKTTHLLERAKVDRNAEANDRGILDYLIDADKGFNDIIGITLEITDATNHIRKSTVRFNEKLEEVATEKSKGMYSYIRNLSKSFAKELVDFSQLLAQQNDRYFKANIDVENVLEFIINFQEITDVSERKRLRDFVQELEKLEKEAVGAKESYSKLAGTIEDQPKFEKHLNRARASASHEIRRLVENIEHTIASIRRAREIGKDKLK